MAVGPTRHSPESRAGRPDLFLVPRSEGPRPDVLPHGLAALAGGWADRRKGRPGRRRRALLVTASLPGAPDAGPGSVLSRAVALRRLGYDVAVAPVDGEVDRPNQILAECGIASLGRPVHRSLEEVLKREAAQLDLVLIQGAELTCAYGGLVRVYGPAVRLVCSLDGLLFPELGRQVQAERRRELSPAARGVQQQELLAAYVCDATILATGADALALRDALPVLAVHVAAPAAMGGEAAHDGFRQAVEGRPQLRLATR